jgi:cytochrome P450
METTAGPATAFSRRAEDLPGPAGIPLLGNALQIDSRRFHADLERWERTYGSLYKFRLGSQTIVVSAQKDEIMRLLRDRPDAIQREQRISRIIEEACVSGIFTAEGDLWRQDRKLVMQSLTPDVIHAFFPEFTRQMQRLLSRWQARQAAGQKIDLMRDLKAFTLDVTIGIAMGQDINALENEGDLLQQDIQFVFDRIARRMTAPVPYWRYLKLPADHEAQMRFARIRDSVAGFIVQSRARLDADPARRAKPANMLEAMLVARDAPGSGYTDLNVIGNAITMVFAGEDTTSTSIAWALHFLSTHPQAAEKMATESDAVLGQQGLADDVASLGRLPYLDAVVSESMRLKPVAAFLTLQSHKPLVLSDTLIDAGTPIMILLRRASENAHPLADGDAFVPERWLADGSRGIDAVNRTIMPFGGGPRFCPGRYLAMVEIREILSMMAKNFRIRLDPGAAPVTESFQFVMAPDSLPISLQPR